MAKQYFLKRGNKVVGPMGVDDLEQRVTIGFSAFISVIHWRCISPSSRFSPSNGTLLDRTT